GRRTMIFTGPRERASLAALDAAARERPDVRWCEAPLSRMAALLGRAAAVVTCDSGLMHVAAARGAKGVAMFGSTSPVLGFTRAGEGHAVLCRNEPCQPCTLHGREQCPLKHFRCMRELKPGDVEAALDGIAGS